MKKNKKPCKSLDTYDREYLLRLAIAAAKGDSVAGKQLGYSILSLIPERDEVRKEPK